MSAFDFRVLRMLFGGQADGRTGSLTGDLSQRDKALIARVLQSTSPGLARNAAGSLGEQLQYLIDALTTTGPANALTASASGSLGQQIAQAATGGGGKTPSIIQTASIQSLGGIDQNFGSTSPYGSAAWPTANKALLIPVVVPEAATVRQMYALNGGTASGNVDVGIYDETGTRIVSKGSTAMSGTSAPQVFDVADTLLAVGRYFLAMACDNTTASFTARAAGVDRTRAVGVKMATASFPLPASLTPAAAVDSYVPVVGAVFNTLAL